jgi:hypothetical protein
VLKRDVGLNVKEVYYREETGLINQLKQIKPEMLFNKIEEAV